MASGIPTYEQFRRSLAGTPMVGEAQGIYNAALRGGINPAFVAGLASAESGYGKEGYAVGTHNPFGLGVHLGWKFPNYTKATERLAKTLKGLGYPQRYKSGGISSVISQYTPYGDASNDPMAHTRNIISAGRRTGGNPSQIYIGQRGGPMAPPTSGGGAMPQTMPGPGTPQPPGVSVGNELRQALIRQYQMSREGTLTPDVTHANTLMLARMAGAGFAQSMRPQQTGMGGGPAVGGGTPSGESVAIPGGTGPVNYGSFRGVVRPLPTKMGASDYGYSGDKEGQGGRHLGDDWFAPANTPVGAPVSGTVFRVKNDPNPGRRVGGQVYGGATYIRDNAGRVWVFRHLESPEKYVQAGKKVRAGDRIGLVKAWEGDSHAHIELYSPGPYEYSAKRAMDPNKFFTGAGIR